MILIPFYPNSLILLLFRTVFFTCSIAWYNILFRFNGKTRSFDLLTEFMSVKIDEVLEEAADKHWYIVNT